MRAAAKRSTDPTDRHTVVTGTSSLFRRAGTTSGVVTHVVIALAFMLLAASCTSDPVAETVVDTVVDPAVETAEPSVYFETLPPGSTLPDGESCAEMVLADPSTEIRPGNADQNSSIVPAAEFGEIEIDGADEFWNAELAPRIDGNFAGTTEQVLRWGACKWGFDENVTRARAVTESSWHVGTEGDSTDDAVACDLLGLEAPCAQSYGLLQVKGSIHLGTYPFSTQSSAFGVDYAMAWLRACYEGSFTWLVETEFEREDGYKAGEEYGCVGTWFSGEWWDQPANDYVGEVRYHVENQSWLEYSTSDQSPASR